MQLPVLPGIRLERRGPVGWLVFDRPEAGNAMDASMLDSLPQAWAALESDEDVRSVVVTGAGTSFQTGLDVRQLARDPEALKAMSRRTKLAEPGLTSWHCGVTKPVVTLVNGMCAGGGLHFVVDSDIAIASTAAVFTDPHVSVGQVSAYESIGLVRRGAFSDGAMLALLGAHGRIGAERARQLGWVSEVVEPEALHDRGQEVAGWAADADNTARKSDLWRAQEVGRTVAMKEAVG